MNKFVADQEKRGVKFDSNSVSEVVKNHENQTRVRQKFQKSWQGNLKSEGPLVGHRDIGVGLIPVIDCC